jgi:aryl carrier-like protein
MTDHLITRPASDTEVVELLTEMWRRALDYDDPEPEDDWFDFGGDSLAAVQLIGKAERRGIDVAVEEFFARPTLAHLLRIASRSATGAEALVPAGSNSQALPLTPTQHLTVVMDGETRDWHNDHLSIRLCEHATLDNVRAAVQVLARRHPALTAAFEVSDGRWRQRVRPVDERSIEVQTVTLPSHHETGPLDARIRELGPTFDLAAGRVAVAVVWMVSGRPAGVTLLYHHLCADGHSIGVLQEHLVAALHGRDHDAREDDYVAWLARIPATQLHAAAPDDDVVVASHLDRECIELSVGDAAARHLAPLLLAAVSRACMDRGPAERRLDMTWHGRDAIAGWPRLGTAVGWFAQVRRVDLPGGHAWGREESAGVLRDVAATHKRHVTSDDGLEVVHEPARLYLNYRGTLLSTVFAAVEDCQPVDLDFGPQTPSTALTPYHLRCVADRTESGVRLSLKYRAGSDLAEAVRAELRRGLGR